MCHRYRFTRQHRPLRFALNCGLTRECSGVGFAICLPPPVLQLVGISCCGGRNDIPSIPTIHLNPSPQAPPPLCSLSLMSLLFIPRFPSPGDGCTIPAHACPAWPAYGLLPPNSNVYRTSENKMSFFSRSFSALERASRCIRFLVVVMNKVLARGNPLPYFPASPTLKLKMRCCAVAAKVFRRDPQWWMLSFWGEQNDIC